ncbi:MAG: histidine phosphatase family protein [Bacillota bacterium]
MIREPGRDDQCLVYLVRHAETSWNADGRFQGQVDTELSPLGRRQAAALGTRLAALAPSGLYTSDLWRARETADLAGSVAGLTATPDRAFREVHVGQWQGLTFDEVRTSRPDSFAEWVSGRAGFRFPQGETYEEGAARAMERLEGLAAGHRGGRLVIVSHGGVLRAMIYSILGLEHGHRGRMTLTNAGVSAIAGAPGRWRLVLLNDTCHLAPLAPVAEDRE